MDKSVGEPKPQPLTDSCERSEGFDIPILDEALLGLLLPNIQSMFKYLNNFYSSESNSKFLDSAAIHFLKVIVLYTTNIHSPAMRHLNVRVTPIFDPSSPFRDPDRHGRIRLYRYIVVTCLLPTIHAFLKYKASTLRNSLQRNENETLNENADDGEDYANANRESAIQCRLAETRQAKVVQVVLKGASIVIPPIQLYHYLSYMYRRKRFGSPSLAMNCNNLMYEPANIGIDGKQLKRNRSINFMYAYRRIVYEELILTMGILPIDAWRTIPKKIKDSLNVLKNQCRSIALSKFPSGHSCDRVHHESMCSTEDHRNTSMNRSCSICGMNPIGIPYKSSCGHWSCYACLRLAISDNLHYRCKVCGQQVESSEPG